MSVRVTPRARRREDRAGDPLDGLVNLFDLGIVLAVAFLLAALSSAKLTPSVLGQTPTTATTPPAATVPRDAVIARAGERTSGARLPEGARVVGRGKAVGTLYELADGRTVVVRRSP